MNSILEEHALLKPIDKYKFKVQIETRLTPAIQKYIIIKNNLLKRFINGKDYRNMLSTLLKKKQKLLQSIFQSQCEQY